MKKLVIAIDYDGTYTEDPTLWRSFIKKARSRGHTVLCVTMRYEYLEGYEVLKELRGHVHQIIFTGRKAKKQFLSEWGINPDVWIEDTFDRDIEVEPEKANAVYLR